MKYFIIALICLSGLTGFSQEKKRPVAVLELVSSGDLKKSEIITLTKRFRDMLVQTDVFNVLERDKMDNILKEQDFILSDDCNSAECAVQVGQLLGVESVITGDIGKIGDTWTVSLRMVDMTTGKIEKTETMDYQGKIDGILDVMRQIAFVFAGKQPPKAKTTLIVQRDDSKKTTEPQGRILIEPAYFAPVLEKAIMSNKSWNKNKILTNEPGGELAISYMITPRLKIGLAGKMYRYIYQDTLSVDPFPGRSDLAYPAVWGIGPKFGYYFFGNTFKPFVDVSVCFLNYEPHINRANYQVIAKNDLEKLKDLKKETGIMGDISLGMDVRIWKYLDLRVAPRLMFGKTKPLYGSVNLNVGLVFHAGKGFPESK